LITGAALIEPPFFLLLGATLTLRWLLAFALWTGSGRIIELG